MTTEERIVKLEKKVTILINVVLVIGGWLTGWTIGSILKEVL